MLEAPAKDAPLMNKREVAHLLNTSTRNVNLLHKAGHIPKPIYLTPTSTKPLWVPRELWASVREMMKRRCEAA